MAILSRNALWRALFSRNLAFHLGAYFAHKFRGLRGNDLQKLPPLSDRLARDIGLTCADMEWSRHKLPSQHTHHPHG